MSGPSTAGPSRNGSPGSSTYASSSFTPLPRSLLAGTGIRFSPTPPPESVFDTHPEAGPSKSSSKEDKEDGEIEEVGIAGGDIFIDEIPQSSPALPGTVEAQQNESTDTSNDHFQPPGLFGTTMMPSLTSTEAGPSVQIQKPKSISPINGKGKDKVSTSEEMDSSLLLPSHVLVDSIISPSKKTEVNGEADDQINDEDDLMEGLHFVDDDISKGSKRYFDPEEDETQEVEATFLATADQSKICQNCKRPGHRSKDCKHIICTTCGAEDSHERRDCPVVLVCFGCGGRGHRKQDCPDPSSRSSRRTGCDRCGSRDHTENTCHTIWRVYAYVSPNSRKEIMEEKVTSEGWEKEAIGGRSSDEWCYNCAKEGHLGDDCQKRRGSLARLTAPSAFSREMATRGPFFNPSFKRYDDLPIPTHSRFDDEEKDDYDELPFISGGYKNFGGSNAGKKTREKQKAKQIQLSRNQGGGSDDDDEPSWFDNNPSNRNGLSIRGRGRGGGGYSTPTNSRNGNGRRPWDSEYRERDREQSYSDRSGRNRYSNGSNSINRNNRGYKDDYNERNRDRSRSPQRSNPRHRNDSNSMPFSHGHLMDSSAPIPSSAPAKVISFGKLSEPGSSSRGGKESGSGAAKALINRALGNNTPSSNNNNSNSPNSSSSRKGKSPEKKIPVVEIPSSSSRSSRKKKNKSGEGKNHKEEKDWENEWRKQGNGGGKVENWGKELDNNLKELNGGIKIKGKSGELNSALGGRREQQQQQSTPSNNNPKNRKRKGGKGVGSEGNSNNVGGSGGKAKNKINKGSNTPNNSNNGGDNFPGEGRTVGGGGGGGRRTRNTGQRYHGGYD
ncbi:uncharacterized protein L201_004268 [Kwoniella dendrophila CBS 6074]|uniref:CCHC-type domain-containing protein n=1 Tax=Kwoniella dendrophila CBS 6074 TaxID=1295534 RepID=A0AAX4JVQ9_9TREE